MPPSPDSRGRLQWPPVISLCVAILLIFIGVVRCLSYFRDPFVGDAVRNSPLWFIAYQPKIWVNAQFFKMLATPSIAGLQYILFRWLNRGHTKPPPYEGALPREPLDFRSPWVRLGLTSAATVNWFVIEVAKFQGKENFYPWSPLEDRGLNAAALVTGQLIAFVGMKYFSFAPFRAARSSPP